MSDIALVAVFSSTIIISYFFNILSKKSGIPSVLMLIALGIVINVSLWVFGESISPPDSLLGALGTVGLILIVLEAALDLKLLKEKVGVIVQSLIVGCLGLGITSYLSALMLGVFLDMDFLSALLVTIPLSILSSAIILPSIDSLDEKRREFMIYESTFSDIVGIVGFYSVMSMVNTEDANGVYGLIIGNLVFTIVFSVVASYFLIYVFQSLKSHAKLFLLISVLLLLFAIGKMFHLSSLIIILIFGVILNNYRLFFSGFMKDFIVPEKIEEILNNFKIITIESAFVVRTFFFIIFGWSIYLGTLLDYKVWLIGVCLLVVIYLVRALVLFVFNGTTVLEKIVPELFLAPRGLITILLFYAIPSSIKDEHPEFDGILLFIILSSCLIMTWSLIKEKKKVEISNVLEEKEGLGGAEDSEEEEMKFE